MGRTGGRRGGREDLRWCGEQLVWERKTYFNRILRRKAKLQPIRFALVQRIRVHNLNVHEPGLEVVGFDERDAWWEFLVHLYGIPLATLFL